MTDDYLSALELRELTGRARPNAQLRWLRIYGWIFALTAAGTPRVLRAYRDHRLGAPGPKPPAVVEPDFSHLD